MACEKKKSSNKRSFTRHMFQMLKKIINKYFTEPYDNTEQFISHTIPIIEIIQAQTLSG